MRIFAKGHKEKLDEYDKAIIENFAHQSEEVKTKIKNIWETEVGVEENVSRDIWKKKKEFLKSLPDKDNSISVEQDQNNGTTTPWKTASYKKNQRNRKNGSQNNQGQVRAAVNSSNNNKQGPQTQLSSNSSNNWRPLQNSRPKQNFATSNFRQGRHRIQSK